MVYPGMRALILRKTLTSLTAAGLVTFREKVIPGFAVQFYGGGRERPAQYEYANKSVAVVGGMDKAAKVLSAEYDLIYVQQAEELTEAEWETLSTRLGRDGVKSAAQLIGDCNPDAPTHWIKRRADRGALLMLESRHEDNPTVTPEYLARLDALTGVRKLRLRHGIWAAAEGLIYEGWDRSKHLIDRGFLPKEWPTDIAIDFGYVNPFVAQVWREDPDGVLYLEREIYRTQTLVEDHARALLDYLGGRRPRLVVCDHDAEGRATFQRITGWRTLPADKSVSAGIQEVQSRLNVGGDGRPRIQIMRDAVLTADASLRDVGKPTCTAEEFESYIWDTNNGAARGERPLKENDHGMDALRYLCKRKARPGMRVL
jgi:phage terminase large subunit